MIGPFSPWPGNPVLRPTGNGWQSRNVYSPAAIVHEGRVVLLYRAHSEDRVSRIGFAVSDDGLHFAVARRLASQFDNATLVDLVDVPPEDHEARDVPGDR